MTLKDKDPINLIIAGVGGQGNILMSRLTGQGMVEKGYHVTIGETYGASQRGGSVASHVRISKERPYSPITPQGDADIILGLEPVESLRLLALFGSSKTFVISNTRPVYPMTVVLGDARYPRVSEIKTFIEELSFKAWYLDASGIAIGLGAPILTNIVMTGALLGAGLLPLDRDAVEGQLRNSLPDKKLSLNLEAFNRGALEIQNIL